MFIKFKDYIRKIKNGVSDDLEDLKLTLKIIENSPFEYSSLAKIVKETNFPLISNVFNDVFGDGFTKYKKEVVIAKIKERIGVLEKYLKNYNSIIRAFDNEMAIGNILDFPFLFATLLTLFNKKHLTCDEVTKIFGSEVAFMGKRGGENKSREDLWKCNFDTLKRLSEYFDNYGNFLNGGDTELFIILFNNLSKASKIAEFDKEGYAIAAEIFTTQLKQNYEMFLKNEKKIQVEKTVVKVEKKKIVVKEVLETDENKEKMTFLTEEDKAIYSKACKVIESIKGRSDYEYYMQAILDIQSLDELYDQNDKEYFDEIIKEAIDKLRVLLNMNKDVVKERVPELVFLNDAKGNCYFEEDVNRIDRGFRGDINLLIEKVKSDGNCRIVLGSNLKRSDLLFVLKSNVAITYCKIAEDTFLVVGVHTLNEGFDQEINRFLANKDYIEELKQLIKNDEYREKLVNEGKLVIEKNITRKLKKKVNNDGKKK